MQLVRSWFLCDFRRPISMISTVRLLLSYGAQPLCDISFAPRSNLCHAITPAPGSTPCSLHVPPRALKHKVMLKWVLRGAVVPDPLRPAAPLHCMP